MSSAARSALKPSRLARPACSSASSSRGKRLAPLTRPCVSEGSVKPPLRPLAPQPAVSASSSTTSRSGRSRLASTAAHRPVKPPPTIARSASSAASSGGAGAGRGRSSQNGTGDASRIGHPAYAAGAVTDFEVATLVFGGLLIAGALASGLAHRSFLSMTAVFVVAGFLLGQGGLEVFDFDAESAFVEDLATVALIVILFRDGLEVEAEMLQTSWRLPLRKIALAMPITCVLVAVVTHALTDLDWLERFLMGALLSPTDPVLSSSVVTNPRVPRTIRHSLNLESGLNDGLALPAVLAFAAAAAGEEDFVWWHFVLQDETLGVAFGLLAGFAAAAVSKRVPEKAHSAFGLGVAFA